MTIRKAGVCGLNRSRSSIRIVAVETNSLNQGRCLLEVEILGCLPM